MKKRDLEIIQSLEKFKCLERDQIAALHFSKNANPVVTANRVLKRLRDTGYIKANTNRSFQQYIYFLNPSPMKKDSQKIDHYLMIAEGYIELNSMAKVSNYEIEPKIDNANFIPDVKCKWMGKEYFIEYQNSLYTTKQMYSKLDKYVEYFNQGYWKDERVLIVGKINMKFDINDYPFKVKQVKGVKELNGIVQKFKESKVNIPVKSVSGGIKYALENI